MSATSIKRIVSIAAALVLSAGVAVALPPTSRQAQGRIVSVEPAARHFTFERADNHQQLSLTWNSRTQFYRDAAKGPASMLKPGQPARVSYRVPVFGPPFVSRVVLQTTEP